MMRSLIHKPMPTSTMLSANGMRQPHDRKASPDIRLKTRTARLAKNRPAGPPNCGQDDRKPRSLLWSVYINRTTMMTILPSGHAAATPPTSVMKWRRCK